MSKENYFKSLLTKAMKLPIFATKKRILVTVIVIFSILFLGFKNFGGGNTAPQYQTAQVQRGTLISSVTESGQVSTGNRVSVTTQASGIVANVYVKNGDSLKTGDKIADIMLDSAGAQKQAVAWAAYVSAQNSLNSAKAKMNSLQSALFKTNQAFVTDRGVINPITDDPKYIEEKADWLQAESDYNNQQGVIAAAQSSLTSAWFSYQVSSSTIYAPSTGTIIDIVIAPGMQIGSILTSSTTSSSSSSNSSSQSVATVQTEGNPIVIVNISEIDATKIKVGDKVTITLDALPNKNFTGKVLGINTTGVVSSGVTNYPTTIVLDVPNDNILPNMSVTASIVTSVKDNVLTVPSAAIQTLSNQPSVRVLKNGQLTSVPVEIGQSSDTDTEIISGVNEGDTVVVGFVSTSQSAGTGSTSPFNRNVLGGFGGSGGGARGGSGARGN